MKTVQRVGFMLLMFFLVSSFPAPVVSAANLTDQVFIPLVYAGSAPDSGPIPPTEPPSEPTPLPGPLTTGVVVLSNSSSFVDSYGDLNILGEVQNALPHPIEYVKVSVNVYNPQGKLTDTDYSYVRLDTLSSGQKGCFKFDLLDAENFSYYEFEPVSYEDSSVKNIPVKISYLNGVVRPDGDYKMIGQVTNQNAVTVNTVNVGVSLYNASGQVIGCGSDYPNNPNLAPGQTSSFQLGFHFRDYSDVNSYLVQAQGQ